MPPWGVVEPQSSNGDSTKLLGGELNLLPLSIELGKSRNSGRRGAEFCYLGQDFCASLHARSRIDPNNIPESICFLILQDHLTRQNSNFYQMSHRVYFPNAPAIYGLRYYVWVCSIYAWEIVRTRCDCQCPSGNADARCKGHIVDSILPVFKNNYPSHAGMPCPLLCVSCIEAAP